MSRENPFYYNLPTRGEDFVGRWPLVHEIVTDLCQPRPDSWAVIGGRRFGKSSALKAVESRLAARLAGCVRGDRHIVPLVVDLKRCGTENEHSVYAGILRALYRALRRSHGLALDLSDTPLQTVADGHKEALSFYQFEDVLDDLATHVEEKLGPLRLVFLLDEVETVTRFSWSETLFNQLRALIYDGPLADVVRLVLTGSAQVVRVRHAGSPLLNAVKIVHLEPFSETDLQTLIARGGEVGEDTSTAVQVQSGGHPFIAQYLLHHLWSDGVAQATPSQVEQIAHHMRQHRAADLQGWWEAIGDSGQQAYAILAAEQDWMDERALVAGAQNAKQPLEQGLAALCYHGLVTRDKSRQRYRVVGRLFLDWVALNVTEHPVETAAQPGETRIVIEHLEQHIGSQTNIDGNVSGPVASGQFESATAIGGGEASDQRGQIGRVGPGYQHEEVFMSEFFSNGYALIVGVGADLPNTVGDAQGLADILKDSERCSYPSEHVHLLTEKNANRGAVLAGLDALAQSAGAESAVVVYFSGHGYRATTSIGEAYYLLPYGYDIQRLSKTAISGQEFADRLRAIPAQKLLVLLDCCHAGGVGDAKAPGLELAKSPLPPEAVALLAEGSGQVLIASSQEDERSFAGKPYSAFTLALIEALSGVGAAKKDGYVRVADVALHAREVVPGRTKGQQHPILHFEHADNFVLAYYAGGDTQPKGLPFDVEPEIEPEPGAWTAFDQRGQTVCGPQTNIAGDVQGPVLSGQFGGPVAVGGGEVVDMRGSQGTVYKPSGPVEQQFGSRITITGDGNVIGSGSRSTVIKQQTTGVTVEQFLHLLTELRQTLPNAGLDPDTAQVVEADLQVAESQARKVKPNAKLILLKLKSVAELLATADGVLGIVERVRPLAQQALEWAGQLFR